MQFTLRKPLQRIYDLLTLLLDAEKSLSKQDVAKAIKCSRPTLDTTIEDANALIAPLGEIVFDDEGLSLQKNVDINKRHIRSLVSNESFIIHFLYDLLFSEIHSIEDWAYERYLSPSTAYKYIREVGDYLTNFELTLENEDNMWMLKGNAWQIRYLYFEILKEKAIINPEWPFEEIDYQAVKSFIDSTMEELDVYISPLIEYQYALMIGIHITIRTNVNVVESINKEKLQFFYRHHDFTNQFAQLEADLNRTLSILDRGMIISSIELFIVNYLSEETLNRRIQFSKETDFQIYQLAVDAYEKFGQNKDNFVNYLDIFSPLQLVKYFQDFSFANIDDKIDFRFLSGVEKEFVGKINEFDQEISNKDYASSYLNNRMYIIKMLCILHLQEQEDKPETPVTVTIISQFGLQQEEYYTKKISKHFTSNKIEILGSKKVHQEDLWKQLDLVISDFTFADYGIFYNIFYIDGCMNDKTMKKLEEKVQKTKNNLIKPNI